MEVEQLFINIESADGDKGVIRDTLDQILVAAQTAYENKEIDADDLSQIQQQRCDIINYYDIEGTSCINPDLSLAPSTPTVQTTAGGLSSVVKIILWIVGILGGGFVVLVIIFAVKARMQSKQEETPEEIPAPTPIPTPTTGQTPTQTPSQTGNTPTKPQ